jgi:hypothetical protein
MNVAFVTWKINVTLKICGLMGEKENNLISTWWLDYALSLKCDLILDAWQFLLLPWNPEP